MPLLTCLRLAVAFAMARQVSSAICENYPEAECPTHNDGGCQCYWDGACKKSDRCQGMGTTAASCVLGDGTQVFDGWHGKGAGDNWCNDCFCEGGKLSCTRRYCSGSGALTCGHVKKSYKDSGCCKDANAHFHLDHSRRMAAASDPADIGAAVKAALQAAALEGGSAKARRLAEQLLKAARPYMEV
mmetsp:Transcript_56818/g.158222  ORF Transcript_56818/g.158222 Transcript_56818/m.158222 type:complete len:186 (-) Transcript_56818:123-680(-)